MRRAMASGGAGDAGGWTRRGKVQVGGAGRVAGGPIAGT
jgi:hypothetical protein